MTKRPTVLVVSASSIILSHLQGRPNKRTFTVIHIHCRDARDFDLTIEKFQRLKQHKNLGAVVITPFLAMQDLPVGLELMRRINKLNFIDAVPLIASSTNEEVLRDSLSVGCTHPHHHTDWSKPQGLEDIIEEALGIKVAKLE
jgi:hypothetical protein